MGPAMTAHSPDRSGPGRLTVRLVIPAATVAVAAGLRVPGAVFAVEKVAVLLTIAVWFHYLLALPDGRLGGAGRRFLVIEDMDLEQDLSTLCEVRVNPWLVEGMDSGTCSVIGVLE